MTSKDFALIYPQLSAWISRTLDEAADQKRSVASAGFKRLPFYFSPELLNRAQFIPSQVVPCPPLTALGLPQFAEFEQMNAAGITYLSNYFVRSDQMQSERLHFHELIHVVQWETLGPEKFLMAYADGLERFGYRNSPLERMAYDAEAAFARAEKPFDAEAMTRERILTGV